MHYAKISKQNAYTLFEIIITSIIIAVLASLAIPKYTTTLEQTRLGEGLQILETLLKAQNANNFINGGYTADFANLDVTIPTPKYFDNVSITAVAGNLASVRRIGGSYSLSIDSTGTITCTSATGICPQIGCRGTGGICNP